MQIRFRARLALPLVLALGLGALVTRQANAQIPGYQVKSGRVVSYSGQVQNGNGVGAGVQVPGTIVSSPSLVNNINNVYGTLVITYARGYGSDNSNAKAQAQATGNVQFIVKITSSARPSSVDYTMGTYGSEGGSLSARNSGTLSYVMGSQHGGLGDILSGISGSSTTVYSYKSNPLAEGPELTTSTPCYYDADGDYVFNVNLTTTVQLQAEFSGGNVNSELRINNVSGSNCSYLKRINGQIWTLGSPEIYSNLSDGNGTFATAPY